MKNLKPLNLLLLFTVIVAYLLLWPVPVSPVSWQAPKASGYTGSFTPNSKLAKLEFYTIADQTGPEAVVFDGEGRLYTSTHEGWIFRMGENGKALEPWVKTQGRPLGMAFDGLGNLIVADAFIGLISIDADGQQEILTQKAGGKEILYANDLAIATDGKIYFSDSSTKFSAKQVGGTYEASLLDLLEHGGHGRLLVFDPASKTTRILLDGLNFANGVALDPLEQYVLVNETGSYRIVKYWLKGERSGQSEVLIDNLPGFPDNLAAGMQGRFWLGLASPRNKLLDAFSDKPWVRKLVQRLPAFIRPKTVAYGHVMAIDGNGKVVASLQDPKGAYPVTTGVAETEEYLYISSLMAKRLGRLSKAQLNQTKNGQTKNGHPF